MRFTVDIEPIGKARPRFTKTGHAYTPQKTKDAEDAIKAAFLEKGGECIPKGVPVELIVTAYFPIPKSFSEKKKTAAQNGRIRPTKKPDIDNIVKLVADALNGVAYEDDAQIALVSGYKEYVGEGRTETGYLDLEVYGDEEL